MSDDLHGKSADQVAEILLIRIKEVAQANRRLTKAKDDLRTAQTIYERAVKHRDQALGKEEEARFKLLRKLEVLASSDEGPCLAVIQGSER